MREKTVEWALKEKIIAIVRGMEAKDCLRVAQALYDGGIRLMEITYDQRDPAQWAKTADAIGKIAEAFEGRMLVAAGAALVTLFPAAALGAGFLKAVRSPISHVRIMAVGGINEKNAAEFLKAGAVGLGVGGNLANRQWIADGAFEKITQTAQALVAAVRTAE